MKATWVLVAIVGCAPARPEKLEKPEKPRRIPEPDVPVDRLERPRMSPPPNVDLSAFTPEFHDELRWPLTPMNHPVMEPKFPIAEQLAQPGVGWLDLCGSGITNRYGGDKELLSYLRGWCSAVDGDTEGACANLAPLVHSTTSRLEAAVRGDLANILAQGHADKAEHFIQVHALRDVGMLDLLAANYVEVGTADDALAINRIAIDTDDYATPATKCMRLTRHIVISQNRTSSLLHEIEAFAKSPKNPDPTCAREYHKLTCWASRDCDGFVMDEGGVLFDADIIGVLMRWDFQGDKDWWELARTVNLELGMPHKNSVLSEAELAEIEIAALENGVHSEVWEYRYCKPKTNRLIKEYSTTLRPFLVGELAQRLADVSRECPSPPGSTEHRWKPAARLVTRAALAAHTSALKSAAFTM